MQIVPLTHSQTDEHGEPADFEFGVIQVISLEQQPLTQKQAIAQESPFAVILIGTQTPDPPAGKLQQPLVQREELLQVQPSENGLAPQLDCA